MARVIPPDHAEVATTAPWAVVVPVKQLAVAKSRLRVLGEQGRQALALAFAEDAVLAALGCPVVRRVLVVTDDPLARQALGALGAQVCGDLPDAGLNRALEHGAEVLRRDLPQVGVAAVSADLPALRSDDLAAVLTRTGARAVVADAAGTGTTLLAAAAGHRLEPAFGPGSLRRHVVAGAEPLPAPAGVRRDVDTPDDLADALRLGVGRRTAAAARALGIELPAPEGTAGPRQGTMLP
jgi:2-phospho-L-lactate/phosphoenolpyruvate guanylyltransferase